MPRLSQALFASGLYSILNTTWSPEDCCVWAPPRKGVPGLALLQKDNLTGMWAGVSSGRTVPARNQMAGWNCTSLREPGKNYASYHTPPPTREPQIPRERGHRPGSLEHPTSLWRPVQGLRRGILLGGSGRDETYLESERERGDLFSGDEET